MIFAFRDGGDVCLAGFGTGCAPEWSAVSDTPLGGGHQGSADDGSSYVIGVRNNAYAFEDSGVVRLRWRGLHGPAKLELAP